ncbi:hypothetical protein HPB48_016156 [Haemaphysalis longicornis]|uniref:Uncharacterized protein n=1 Tax=Haemaphysalis longicornis TaxID=44386 RepID=A0A9J6H4M1_HAELO|nr:hypothetical protein HPB48_016156 [Haemaphysalis longicornis]
MEELEEALMGFFDTERAAWRAESNRLLQEHARKLVVQMNMGISRLLNITWHARKPAVTL